MSMILGEEVMCKDCKYFHTHIKEFPCNSCIRNTHIKLRWEKQSKE